MERNKNKKQKQEEEKAEQEAAEIASILQFENDFHSLQEDDFMSPNDKSTQTDPPPEKKDASVGPEERAPVFTGVNTILLNKCMKSLLSVSEDVFNMFHDMLHDYYPKTFPAKEMLIIFLLKIKYNLPFSALGDLYSISHSTVSYNFYAILDILYQRTQEFVFWPSKEDIQVTMPDCFKGEFSNCRVIIDCSEVKTEKPCSLEEQNEMYSFYKSGHTFKFLLGKFGFAFYYSLSHALF